MSDLWFYGIFNLLKDAGRGSSNFREIRPIVLHQLTQLPIFSDFEFFENFLKIVLLGWILFYRAKILCVNALIPSDVWL